jgi:hypothetical protein
MKESDYIISIHGKVCGIEQKLDSVIKENCECKVRLSVLEDECRGNPSRGIEGYSERIHFIKYGHTIIIIGIMLVLEMVTKNFISFKNTIFSVFGGH